MSSPTSRFTVGTRVRLKDTYLDEALTQPVTGTVRDIQHPDWNNPATYPVTTYVVMFDHEDPSLPPGGEFSARTLEALSEAR